MKLYLIGMLITLVISGYLTYRLFKDARQEKEIGLMIFTTPFIWILFFTCSLFAYFFVELFCEQQKIEDVEVKRIEIIALNNFSSLQGKFFLATGNINSIPSYVYYYKTHDGGIGLDSINAKFVTVFEEDSADAHLALVGTKIIYRKPTNLLIQMFVPVFWMPEERISNTRWTIHVPKGTIVRQVNLDLKDFN